MDWKFFRFFEMYVDAVSTFFEKRFEKNLELFSKYC